MGVLYDTYLACTAVKFSSQEDPKDSTEDDCEVAIGPQAFAALCWATEAFRLLRIVIALQRKIYMHHKHECLLSLA